jgi:hypothetical protein
MFFFKLTELQKRCQGKMSFFFSAQKYNWADIAGREDQQYRERVERLPVLGGRQPPVVSMNRRLTPMPTFLLQQTADSKMLHSL